MLQANNKPQGNGKSKPMVKRKESHSRSHSEKIGLDSEENSVDGDEEGKTQSPKGKKGSAKTIKPKEKKNPKGTEDSMFKTPVFWYVCGGVLLVLIVIAVLASGAKESKTTRRKQRGERRPLLAEDARWEEAQWDRRRE